MKGGRREGPPPAPHLQDAQLLGHGARHEVAAAAQELAGLEEEAPHVEAEGLQGEEGGRGGRGRRGEGMSV